MFSLLIGLLLIGSGVWIYKLFEEQEYLRDKLKRYSSLASAEDFQIQVDNDIQHKQKQVLHLDSEAKVLQDKIIELRQEMGIVEEESELHSLGFYETKYSYISSGEYSVQLKHVKKQQQQMATNKQAVVFSAPLILNQSLKDGEKLAKHFRQLILKVFNTWCDDVIKNIKPGQIEAARLRIESQFSTLNKAAQIIHAQITQDFLELKFLELDLQHDLKCKLQEEKEIADQIRKDNQRLKQLEKVELEMRDAEERELSSQQKLYAIRQLAKEEQEKLKDKIDELEIALEKAHSDREAAEEKSRMIKSGHIYVISNIGSLGRDVYRICSTRRMDEKGYISDMNRMVPFPFDIHFQFFSEDVGETLTLLHNRFNNRRINKINPRREFFNASFEEIASAIEEIHREKGMLKNFIIEEKTPSAYEYRKTQQIEERLMDHQKIA